MRVLDSLLSPIESEFLVVCSPLAFSRRHQASGGIQCARGNALLVQRNKVLPKCLIQVLHRLLSRAAVILFFFLFLNFNCMTKTRKLLQQIVQPSVNIDTQSLISPQPSSGASKCSKTIESAPSASMNRTILAFEDVVRHLFMTLVASKCAPARCPVPMRALVVTNQVVSCALHKSSTPCSS